jgi:YjbE family integral membrane protein
MLELITPDVLSALFQVVMIDLALAGDNAIVIGLAAAGLPAAQRGKAILVGIIVATVLRILFATVTTQLLEVIGLLLAGGVLLLWVCWKMYRELQDMRHAQLAQAGVEGGTSAESPAATKTFRQAAMQIVIADLSMSLDNVLAVAGAAREHPGVLVFGLALSIGLMGFAANSIARLLQRYHWIAYIGLVTILYVALDMIWRGSLDVLPYVASALPG